MAWTQPLHTRDDVRAAGETLIAPLASAPDREAALAVTNNWRSSHAFPLNTVQVNLRRVARDLDPEPDPTVAQRIKRLSSIVAKLERLSRLSLDQIQDLGGCRAVLSSVAAAEDVATYYRSRSAMRHRLVREVDYIARPKASGYRGIHIIYSYVSDRTPTYDGLMIEMQIRSRLQHAWATAVETVGTFTDQALKTSAGDENWLRFFVLMSSALAAEEERPPVPGTGSDALIARSELRELADQLRVIERLRFYGHALQIVQTDIEPRRRRRTKELSLVLQLDTAALSLTWGAYDNPAEAAAAYDASERACAGIPAIDVVLVRVDSLAALRRAYPNYFADTEVFVDAVTRAVA